MAATQVNGLKRQHPDDDLEGTQKRPRSQNGSPAPHINGQSAGAKPDINKIIADARLKAAALAAKKQGNRPTGQGDDGISTPTNSTPGAAASANVKDRIAELRARVAAAKNNSSPALPRATTTAPPGPAFSTQQFDDGMSKGRGGLDVGLHPALMGGDSGHDSRSAKGRQAIQPKFATTMANRRIESPLPTKQVKPKKQLDISGPSLEELKDNPYFDPTISTKAAATKGRIPRAIVFNQKGKYIQQAAALRRQAALEAMKKRIAMSSRKAGMVDEIESEKVFLVSEPPEIEWWDEGIVDGSSYSEIDSPDGIKIDTANTVITAYVQHPVAIEPPQEKNRPAPKSLPLTKKEQKKKRRQDRMAEHKEEQMKVRLGLKPAEPPKVKKGNMMRVLGEEAVKDPTAVEMRVNREIAERQQKHMNINEERKLTKEQKHEKLAAQQEADAAKGIYCAVYRIESLANGRHRFKISKNAEQNALKGITILHPKYCLVIVEGGQHSMKSYKKLMLQRIDWTHNDGSNPNSEGTQETPAWLQAEDENGSTKDLSTNACTLVFEGQQKVRAFRKWQSKVCETDKDAKDALSRAKMDAFWTLARGKGPVQS